MLETWEVCQYIDRSGGVSDAGGVSLLKGRRLTHHASNMARV